MMYVNTHSNDSAAGSGSSEMLQFISPYTDGHRTVGSNPSNPVVTLRI